MVPVTMAVIPTATSVLRDCVATVGEKDGIQYDIIDMLPILTNMIYKGRSEVILAARFQLIYPSPYTIQEYMMNKMS